MASSPPTSASGAPQRPKSAIFRASRSSSRMSFSSKQGGYSRASDEDSRTAVKVAVRIRPPLKSTDPGFELIPQRFQRSMVQVTSPTNLVVESPQNKRPFVFDRVFDENVNQKGVWEYLSESVDIFLQGFNVSVLAYGQSGAGKSYTMGTSGPIEQNDAQLMGVIPRAAGALFEKLAGPPTLNRNGSSGLRSPTRYSANMTPTLKSLSRANGDKSWHMFATYVEIYHEQLRDLLVPEHVPVHERGTVSIREDTKGRILLTGLHQVEIHSIDDLLGALNFGSAIRQTDVTAINAKSSRSHAVFSLNLIQRVFKGASTPAQEKRMSVPLEAMTGATDNWVTVDSKLHFVDLAGSERLKNSGASGDRAREGIAINAGLASLGKVISQLSSRQAGSHVSYRDSKLTRLLQDSLGGNAVTYMIACVTPAEFHLNETLNTLSYADRARAIQSKPQIQQVSDENDKQALIDRLRAEVSFLRDQIRNTERGDFRSTGAVDRSDRQNEREIELQNHLLDIQENYGALSQRHAKLISEITKARDNENTATPTLDNAIGDSAVERLKRSNSFAEAAEHVVLEYEKTIQSLETSLSNTRSSLATTESSLLERETKCAYVETVNQQLQARMQKMMDREASTEHYLHDLEAKIDGHTSGEEKNSAIVIELRKEIARVRENEASCEDYISTLEERLAEADQDMELMQREVDRLEHVVERQRSLGKLDSLLHELDNIHQNGKSQEEKQLTNGSSEVNGGLSRGRSPLRSTLKEAIDIPIPESDGEDGENPPPYTPTPRKNRQVNGIQHSVSSTPSQNMFTPVRGRLTPQDSTKENPAQLGNIPSNPDAACRELLDLRLEHESTVSELDLLSAKYDKAIRTLAEFQASVTRSRNSAAQSNFQSPSSTRPTSFLEDAGVDDLKDGGRLPSSRSLSSELYSAGESPPGAVSFDDEPSSRKSISGDVARVMRKEETLAQEVERMRKIQGQREADLKAMNDKYSHLEEEHLDTLDFVEELKAEVQKAKMNGQPSPTNPVILRKSSQNLLTIDRAHRSLASLRNIATEHLEGKVDTMQSFDLNLNTAMHELHQRSERVQVVEAELATVKKEMEMKTTIISGLTRERTSLKGSSPMDLSVVSSMRDQLMQNENQIRMLQEEHAAREQALVDEVETLKESLDIQLAVLPNGDSGMPGGFPETPAVDITSSKQLGDRVRPDNQVHQRVSELQGELLAWEEKHTVAVQSMQAYEKKLLTIIAELEASMENVEVEHRKRSAKNDARADSMSVAVIELEKESVAHAENVKLLLEEIDFHKASHGKHLQKIAELEQAEERARQQVIEERSLVKEAAESQTDSHHEQVSHLQQIITELESSVEFHKYGLKSLHDSHSRELDNVRKSAFAQAEEDHSTRFSETHSKHKEELKMLEHKAQTAIQKVALLQDAVDRYKDDCARKDQEYKDLTKQMKEVEEANNHIIEENHNIQANVERLLAAKNAKEADDDHLQTKETQMRELRLAFDELTKINNDNIRELEIISGKERKASRLVDELEEQIATTYDQHQATSSRFSVIQTENSQALFAATAAVGRLEEELDSWRSRAEQAETHITQLRSSSNGSNEPQHVAERSDSVNSNLRKSISAVSLPSPPPAIPLPPLPNHASSPMSPGPNVSTPYDPASRHASKEIITSPIAAAAPNHVQQQEEMEQRVRTIEKHLFAEKQLTATLEEALVDLEAQGNKVKAEVDMWRKKARSYEDELTSLRKYEDSTRFSLQAVEEERKGRREAERARAQLEERMVALNKKSRKRNVLNCF